MFNQKSRWLGNSIKEGRGSGHFFFFLSFFCFFFFLFWLFFIHSPFPQRWRVVSVIEKARFFFSLFFLNFNFNATASWAGTIKKITTYILHRTTEKMSLFRLGLIVICFWPLLQSVDSEHVRVTLQPGQYFTPSPPSPPPPPFVAIHIKRSYETCSHMPDRTEIGAFELTVPALVKTMTEVSLVTVTQLSMETTTVEGACSTAATAVGIFFLSSRTQTLAKPW